MTKKTAPSARDVKNDNHEELRDSVKWLRLAVGKIQQLLIPASPENYAIWYEYYSGRKPALKLAIDRRLSEGQVFSPEICRQLYSQYFGDGPEQQLSEVRRAIRSLINRLTIELQELDTGMENYDQFLTDCDSELSGEPEVKSLQKVVKDLLVQTKKCRTHNQKAIAQVSTLNKEVDLLRQTLKVVSEAVLEDTLTRVGNRRGFDSELAKAIDMASDMQQPFVLILLDIDLFKRVNDKHGHLVGDRVLRFVAESIKKTIKGTDYVARYGGEEFAVVLPNTDHFGGLKVANAILRNVANTKLTVSKGGPSIGSVTLSGGLSVYQSGESIEQFIERTDKSLYRAKKSGRNCISSDQETNKNIG